MRSILLLAALLSSGAAAAESFTPPSVVAPLPAARDFKDEFMRAYKIGDRAGMSRVARDRSTDVAFWMFDLAERVTTADDPESAKLYEALGRAWRDAFNTGFADNVLDYLGELSLEDRRSRRDLVGDYRTAATEYVTKRGEESTPERDAELQLAGVRLDGLGQKFYDLGDMYFASRCWIFAGDAFSPRAVREDAAIAERELEYLKKALDACEKVDVGDPQQRDTRTRVRTLEVAVERGAKPAAEAGEASAAKLPYTFGAAVETEAGPEVLGDVKKQARLSFGWDDMHPTWQSIYLGNVGARAPLAGMENGPVIERQDVSDVVVIDPDGKARFVQLTTEPQVVTTRIGTGDNAYDYSVALRIGGRTDRFQGFTVNMEPTAAGLTVYALPVAASSFKVGKTDVYVTDDNMDGVFGGAPREWTAVGLPRGVLHPHLDGVFVGRAKRAQPFSEVLQVGREWYRVEPVADGRAFRVAPAVDLPVGEVKLTYKGADLDWVVIRGEGAGKGMFFALEHGKAVEVPAGSYRVYTGLLRDGEAKALMVAGDAEPFEVRAGESTDLALGGPYRFGFSWSLTPEGVRVRGESVHVIGVGGEHYHRLWNCRVAPEIHLRTEGGGSWTEVGAMTLIDSVSGISERGEDGWAMAWWPLDTVVENKFGDAVEVRLHERKNPLFGRIDSAAE